MDTPSGMDRRISRKKWPISRTVAVGATVATVAILVYSYLSAGKGRTYVIPANRLSIATVVTGEFEDFVPIRGQIEPLKSVYLDAIEGGRVEKIFVEEGSLVSKDDMILELSNTALQLEVIAKEAAVSEQVNNLRNTRLAMEQNALDLKKDLLDIEKELVRLDRALQQNKRLYGQQLISREEYLESQEDHAHYLKLRDIVLDSQKKDEAIRKVQMQQLEQTTAQLERNLNIARQNLESMVVKAPVSGLLSSLDVEIGQSKSRGERLGRIDDTTEFKTTSRLDEFYVQQIQVGQVGSFELDGKTHVLNVSKIYPQIENGQFKFDLVFQEPVAGLRSGQTLQIRLQLGGAEKAILLPRGGFHQDTGGQWVFALEPKGSIATKRKIRLGRRNLNFFEVLEGLRPGDRVVVSDYDGFDDMTRLKLVN